MPNVRPNNQALDEITDDIDNRYMCYRLRHNPDGTIARDLLASSEYFVLRSQDVFGPAAVYGYAHLVLSFVEAAEQGMGIVADADIAALKQLAEDARAIADRWQAQPKKLPDK